MYATREAAYRAAGSVIDAIDHMYLPANHALHIDSAYCAVRPPGHHAEPGRSMGFCFFNNAGIAAMYAQQKYGAGRVAVVDFDVHHGNGTEEGFLPHESLFYGSTHERYASLSTTRGARRDGGDLLTGSVGTTTPALGGTPPRTSDLSPKTQSIAG